MAGILKKVERGISKLIPHEHSADRRAAMQAVNEQMQLYKAQKDKLQAENDRISKEKDMERQRLHEKQIRSLRRGFRRSGFLGSSLATPSGDQPAQKLG